MNVQEAKTYVNYTYWARDRVLDAVAVLSTEQFTSKVNSSFGSVRDTLVHVLSAESVWLSRWKGEVRAGMLTPDSFPDFATLKGAWKEEEAKMRAFIETVDDAALNRVIEYKTFNGQAFSNRLFEMLQHVVNHGSYHRGQVTTLLRQLGAAPPKQMDLIFYYREQH